MKTVYADLRARAEKATPGPWRWDSYNTICEAAEPRRIMASIPDHPFDDGPYEPNQIAERGAWYNESASNAHFIEAANPTVIIELLDRLEQAESWIEHYRGERHDLAEAADRAVSDKR